MDYCKALMILSSKCTSRCLHAVIQLHKYLVSSTKTMNNISFKCCILYKDTPLQEMLTLNIVSSDDLCVSPCKSDNDHYIPLTVTLPFLRVFPPLKPIDLRGYGSNYSQTSGVDLCVAKACRGRRRGWGGQARCT